METKPITPPPFSTESGKNKTRLYGMPAEQKPAPTDKSARNAAIAGAAAGLAGAAAGFAAGSFSAAAGTTDAPEVPEIEIDEIDENDNIDVPGTDHETYNDNFNNTTTSPSNPSSAPTAATDQRDQPEEETIEEHIDTISPEQDIHNPEDDLVIIPDEPVDTDEIADAIIAEDLIDPYDYEPVDMLGSMEVLDIGEMTLEDGSDVTVASFTIDGDLYGMVDLNNDGEMDLVIDSQGESQWVAGIMTSDLEEQMANPDEYLAYDETIENDLSIGLDIDQDIING